MLCGLSLKFEDWLEHFEYRHSPLHNACACPFYPPPSMLQHIHDRHTRITYICTCDMHFNDFGEAIEHALFDNCTPSFCNFCDEIICLCDEVYAKKLKQIFNNVALSDSQ